MISERDSEPAREELKRNGAPASRMRRRQEPGGSGEKDQAQAGHHPGGHPGRPSDPPDGAPRERRRPPSRIRRNPASKLGILKRDPPLFQGRRPGQQREVAIDVQHRNAMPDRAGGDQAIDAGPDRNTGSPGGPVKLRGLYQKHGRLPARPDRCRGIASHLGEIPFP
jgi:hypothetical protein